jgi:hypothetical protein
VGTPFNGQVHLSNDMSPKTDQQKAAITDVPYRSAVGALMYLCVATRPDIACAVFTCARFLNNPGEGHWEAVKRIFRYLQGTTDRALVYNCGSGQRSTGLTGFSDSDWAQERDQRRSTTGYVFYLHGCAVSWVSRLQHTIAHSSTEAEYMAASDAVRETIWLRNLLKEVTLVQSSSASTIKVTQDLQGEPLYQKDVVVRLGVDNQGAINLANNPVHHNRSKHIDIKHHAIRQRIAERVVHLTYVNTKMNDADIFTKTTLSVEDFRRQSTKIMGN